MSLRASSQYLVDQASKFGFEIRPLTSRFAAEIHGVTNLGHLETGRFEFIKSAFEEFSVLVVKNQQDLPVEDLIGFSRKFGPLEHHVLQQFTLPQHPEIYVISNEKLPDGRSRGLYGEGQYWHSDLSYLKQPSLGSFLHAQTLPGHGDGDTLFVSMQEVYDGLPVSLKERIDCLWAEHNYEFRIRSSNRGDKFLDQEQKDRVPPVVHPIVRIHENTGRRALFVSEGFTTKIIGLSEEDSDQLLRTLFNASTQGISIRTDDESLHPRGFAYRHKWTEGDLVMWDNRALIHHAIPSSPEQARTLYRTTIQGPVPIPVHLN
jgi:taurine dioxygenase